MSSGRPTLVLYDLETTGTEAFCQILQLSATDISGKFTFDEHLDSSLDIHPKASDVNNLYKDEKNRLYRLLSDGRRQYVMTGSAKRVLQSFVVWLEERFGHTGVVLAAFNGVTFDHPRLLRALVNLRVEGIDDVVVGFADPKLLVDEIDDENYSQKRACEAYNVDTLAGAHNAMFDAENLRRLVVNVVETEPDLPIMSMLLSPAGIGGDRESKKYYLSMANMKEREARTWNAFKGNNR